MKQRAILNLHSTVDVITNSSTEIFILRGIDKQADEIRTLCRQLLDAYNTVRGTQIPFDAVFGFIGFKKASEVNEIIDGFGDTKHILKGCDVNDMIMVIEGLEDNSIPYPIMNFLGNLDWKTDENWFFSHQIHLG